MILFLVLLLAPAPKAADPGLHRPTYAARTQLTYELYTLEREEKKNYGLLLASGNLVLLPAGTTYRVIPLVGDELQERPVCAHLRLLSGEHRDQTVYVVASDLEAGK
jgi:hypothetical protein